MRYQGVGSVAVDGDVLPVACMNFRTFDIVA